MTMFINLIVLIIGLFLYAVECCVKGITCCPKGDEDEPSLDEEGEPKQLTMLSFMKRLLHWGMFSGLFLTIFVYSSTIAQEPCQNNPNLCTVLFRSSLFLTAVMILALINAERRGGRLDWFVAILLAVGISLLLWTHNGDYSVDFQKEFGILVGGGLVNLSFSVVLISLRRGVQGSSIARTVWIMSLFGFITMVGLSSFFEGATPWKAMHAGGFGLIWRILAVMGVAIAWQWFIVMSLAFSETIIVALALQFSLLFGDMGIHNYIFAEWTFSATFIVGLAFVCFAFLWLLKRVVTLNCPDLCGKWCAWGVDRGEYSDEELELLESDEDPRKRSKTANKKYGEQYLERYRKEATYGTGSHGSGSPSSKKKHTHW